MLKVVLWFVGIWAVLLIVLQVALSEKVLTKLVNRYAAEYIDGDLSFGSASVSMFRRFPNVALTLEDFSVTYPADRFDEIEKLGAQGHLMREGQGAAADTLASFDRFSASVNVPSLLAGTVRIPHLRLVRPRIFIHSYANGDSNMDIFRFGSDEEDEDPESVGLPDLSLGRIRLSRHPHIVYTDSRDTVFAVFDVARIGFNGHIKTKTKEISRNRTGLTVDSMFVAGRVKTDTLALAVESFSILEDDGHMDIDATGKALVASGIAGRIHLPIGMSGRLDFPKDTVPAVVLNGFKANIGDFPLVADADLRFKEGRTGIKAKVGLDRCRLDDICHGFARNMIPELDKVHTDAELTVLVECDGDYDGATGQFPPLTAMISMQEAGLEYRNPEGLKARVGIRANGSIDSKGRMYVVIDGIQMKAPGLDINLKGGADDLLGKNPKLRVNGQFAATLDSLATFLPDSLGISAEGSISANLQGQALMSQLNMYNFSFAEITGNLTSDSLAISVPKDTINADIKGLRIVLAPEEKTSRRDSTHKFRLMGITANLEKADITYGSSLTAKVQELTVSAKNSVDMDSIGDTSSRISPLGGRLKAKRIIVRDASSTSINLKETDNGFQLLPKKGQPKVPMLTLRSSNGRITLSSGKNRVILTDADLKAKAAMNSVERKQKAKAFRDSLARAYPDVPMDSLMAHMRSQRGSRPVPEWLKEEDFKKQDINIRLDETLAGYFRDWDLDGGIDVRTGVVMTPYFPMRNILRGFDLRFNNNEVKIDSFKVVSGSSEIEAKGALTGLKGALLGRGRGALRFDLNVSSSGMDANELLTAYNKGSRYVPEGKVTEEISDAELMKEMMSDDTTDVDFVQPLIVVPANLMANINLNAKNVRFTDLQADSVTARIVMKERCIQITETQAQTNMGGISFDAFYSTRSKQNLKAGFDLNFKDITADKVIDLMPAIDTIMPLLKSFSGLLNCEVAATASLDTNMNLIMPSINGIFRAEGEDLTIKDSEMYSSIARKLHFKNKQEGRIEKMTVEGIISDNTLEIFPFVIKLDRYTLALSGLQNLDMSYRYHASLIKSPFVFKLGVDVYGNDFDNMKFKVGKAKYKDESVPVFSTVIDQTKVNLLTSIRNIFEKGVDAAVNENMKQSAIMNHKRDIGYVKAVDMEIEELSPEEKKQMEEAEATPEAIEEQTTSENK